MKKRFYLPVLILGCLMMFSTASKAGSRPITTSDLMNDTVCAGSATYFIFGASDTSATPDAITYQWQISTTGGSSWSALTSGGAYTITSDSLYIAAPSVSLSGNKYRCIATNLSGSDTSYAAFFRVDTAYWGAITGPSTVCVNAQVTLSGTVGGGTWSATNDSATISSAGIVTGVQANGATGGKDTVIYTIVNTCGTGSDTAYITINPIPATGIISGASIVCVGNSITLTESLTGGVWSRSHAFVDTVTATGVVTGLHQGFDTVKYTTTNGLCNASATHPVRVDTVVSPMPITGPSTSCVAHTITLANANIYGTWTWSLSNSHATVNSLGSVYGVSGGLDTVTYNFTNACNSVSSTTTVLIDVPLSPGVISGSSSVCAGSWIHLTESTTGGIWLSSNSALAVVDGSGNVTGVAQGSPVISYLISNGCGAVAATHTVNVSRLVSAISGLDSVGIGNTITLSDSAISGTWSVSSSAIATVGASSGIVTGVAAGTTTVSYSVTNACGTSYATKTIHVGPAPFVPEIMGSDSVCLGTTITLVDTLTGGTWSIDDTLHLATISATGLLTGVAYGATMVTYTYHNAFGTSSVVKSIFVNDKPNVRIAGPSIVSLGGNYFMVGVPKGGTWTASNATVGSFVSYGVFNDTAVGSEHHLDVTFGSFVVIHPGSDTLKYSVTNSCGTVSKTFVMTLARENGVAPVFEEISSVLSVFPNPTMGDLTLSLSSDANEAVAVTVTNILGQKVKELNITTNKNFNFKLDQPSGLYIINAVTESGARYNTKVTLNK